MVKRLTKQKNTKLGKKSYKNNQSGGGGIFSSIFRKKNTPSKNTPSKNTPSKNTPLSLTTENFKNIKENVLNIPHLREEGVHPYDVKIIYIFLNNMNYFKNLKNTYPPKYINSVINDPMFAKSNTSTYKPIYIEAFNKLFFGKDKGQFKKEISTKYNESGKTLGNTMYYDWIEKYLFLNQYINKNDSQFLAYLLDLISYDVKKDRDAIVRDNNKMTCNDIINNSKPLVSVRLKDLIFTKEECKKIIQLANKDEKLEKDRNSRVQ